MFYRAASGLMRFGTGVGAANFVMDFGQNRYHYNNGHITKKEFHWRTLTGAASNLPCNFMKSIVVMEDLHVKTQDGSLGVSDMVTAISSLAPLDVMGMMKAGGNVFNCANYMLESQNVMNHMDGKTGNEVEQSLFALQKEWAGPVGSTRPEFRQ